MVSFMQRLSFGLRAMMPTFLLADIQALAHLNAAPGFRNLQSPIFGSSKRTVAQDQRRAAKARARRRAKKLGQV